MITANELRQKYLDFFKEKGHAIIPSAPVVPENDPTVLYTTAGMHPLVPYLMGEKHPQGKRLADVQKCIRTPDIDDVGDNRHLTFFEMLGNWSLGDYFKKEAIEWSWEFLTDPKWLGLDPKRIYVTVFAGDEKAGAGKDEQSIEIWKKQYKKIGMEAGVCGLGERVKDDSRIFLLGMDDNFWGPAGESGPCGPCSEMFYDVSPEKGKLEGTFEQQVDGFRLMEIWNDVFMEFNKKQDGSYEKMDQQNVDTGMGLERTVTVLSGKENVFDTDLFLPIIEKVEELSGKKYSDGEEVKKSMRIIADHIKAAVFIIADGVEPSNTERGYVLRRLIRRAVRQGHVLGIDKNFTAKVVGIIIEMYKHVYPEISSDKVTQALSEEEEKFRKTLEKGLREITKNKDEIIKLIKDWFKQGVIVKSDKSRLTDIINRRRELEIKCGKILFYYYQTYGFPLELILEEFQKSGLYLDELEKDMLLSSFNEEFKKHQELSRTASVGMFKGGLADTKEKTTQLHTAAHLMLAGLRKVLGGHVHQKGSNINGERIRFDFSHPDKMTDEQKKAVEDFVNGAIVAKVPVVMEEMELEKAREIGAEGAFEDKYGDRVKVYAIEGYSKEICGGPHVKNTGDIQGVFKIKKEQSSSAGVRRIKAVME